MRRLSIPSCLLIALSYAIGCLCGSGSAHASQTETYTYDALGRLTQAQHQSSSGSGTTLVFKFDAAGNRTQYKVLIPVTLSMNSGVVNLTSAGAHMTVDVSDATATGTVTFTDAETGTDLGSASVVNGQASATMQGLSQGAHTITASYSGDDTHAPQVTTFTVKVMNLSWLPAVLNLLLQ